MTNETLKKILGTYMRHNEDMHDCYLEVLNDCGQLVDYVHFLEQEYRVQVSERADTEEEVSLLSVFFANVLLEIYLQNKERAMTIVDEFNKKSYIEVDIRPSMTGDTNVCWLTTEDDDILVEYEEDVEKWH